MSTQQALVLAIIIVFVIAFVVTLIVLSANTQKVIDANEALVEAFLRDGIPYLFIGASLCRLLEQAPSELQDTARAADLDAVLAADARGRADAAALMENRYAD